MSKFLDRVKEDARKKERKETAEEFIGDLNDNFEQSELLTAIKKFIIKKYGVGVG